jgi:hypothetical protein
MDQHIPGGFYLRVMANRWQFGAIVQSAIQRFVARYHMTAGNGILCAIDQSQGDGGCLQCRYPALPMLTTIADIGNQIMKEMFAIIKVNQLPEILQLLLRWLAVIAKYRAKILTELLVTSEAV